MTMGPLTPTSKGAWQIAYDRCRDAERTHDQLERARADAASAAERARYDLNAHEAAPGVPRWQHLQTTPDADACRLRSCREHGRYMSELPYATPYTPDDDDPADDEEPF